MGCEIVEEYVGEGFARTTRNRPELDKLIKEAITKSTLWNDEEVLPSWETTSGCPEGERCNCHPNLLLKVDEKD